MRGAWIISVICLCAYAWRVDGSTKTYYMVDRCGEILDMRREDVESVELKLTKKQRYDHSTNCVMRLMAPENKRFIIKIESLDIQWEHNCSKDYLQIYDGASVNDGIIGGLDAQICSSTMLQRGYVSNDRFVTLKFHSDGDIEGWGFTILLTAFRTDEKGMCYNTEFECKSSRRCISSLLICDGYDNCIDDSDECRLSTPVIIGISVGCGVMFLAIIGIVVCCCVWRRNVRESSKRKDEPTTDDVSSAAQLYRPTHYRRPVYTIPSLGPEYKYMHPDPSYVQPIYIREYPDYSNEYQPAHAWTTDTDRHTMSWYN